MTQQLLVQCISPDNSDFTMVLHCSDCTMLKDRFINNLNSVHKNTHCLISYYSFQNAMYPSTSEPKTFKISKLKFHACVQEL